MKFYLPAIISLFIIPLTAVAQFQVTDWKAGTVLSESAIYEAENTIAFSVNELPSPILNRITGKSLPASASGISAEELRYIPMLHYNLKGEVMTGEMIVNKAIADDVAYIFRQLYIHHYPIESIRLIDDFEADDQASMTANNTSAFCFRQKAEKKELSNHSLGLAIDLNPLYNPYISLRRNARGDSIGYRSLQPSSATPYVDRSADFPYKITPGDMAYRLFRERGFIWGGHWKSIKDYQHFEKPLPKNRK